MLLLEYIELFLKKWIAQVVRVLGILFVIGFCYGMGFLFVMMNWFPEWEIKYEKHNEVKRHAELSKKLGRTATMSEYYKSLSNIDVSTSVGFVDAIFGIKK